MMFGDSASLDGTTINDWHCHGPDTSHFNIDVNALCSTVYNSAGALARYGDFNDPSSWACYIPLGSMDISGYCGSLGDVARLDGMTINDWHCYTSDSANYNIPVDRACQRQYNRPDAYARYSNVNDPTSGHSAEVWPLW